MKEFEIWAEGYAITGNHSGANFIGKGMGNTFDEAVGNYMKNNPNSGINLNTRSRYTSKEAYENRDSNWNTWACNLYDNEVDARKSFG